MQNTFALLLFYLISNISLADPIVDVNENDKSNFYNKDYVVKLEARESNFKNKITKVLEDVLKECDESIKERLKLERKLSRNGRVIKPNQRKADISLIRKNNTDHLVHQRESAQLPMDEASYRLNKRFNFSRDEINRDLPTVPLDGELSRAIRDACLEITTTTNCNARSRYRTADGQCNNIQNPSWGSALSCQRRMLHAYYEGNSGYRTSVDGGDLPEPRSLSLNLHYHLNRPTNYVTHMYMFFGQLLDHDITLTPTSTTVDNQAIECCPPEVETHPQCRPISVARNDPFYSQFGVTCLNFVRSAICSACQLGARQQMNQVTAFIDASMVYGSSTNETIALRRNDGTGRMRTQSSTYGDLLPRSQNPEEDQCSFPETNDICFEAGDSRANQHTVLTSLHTIFLREHNRIATALRRINRNWNDERLFQESRRIVGAEMQIITYKEYLPITIGRDRMTYFDLYIGDRTRYNASKDPSMITEFTTAAFRFGHSLINSVIVNRPFNNTNGRRLLRNEFFQPFDLYDGFIGPLLKGSTNSPAQWFDRHLVPDVTNFLYRVRGNQTGLDLAAININRGRDHGVPPYVVMVRYCSEGRIVIRNFNDLVTYRLMDRENAVALGRNYRFVEDVDLWTGILMETPNDGAVVGPTAACIIGVQFKNLKFGDRFFVVHANEAGSFTYQQLEQLRRITLSEIICLNSNISELPWNAMLFNSRNNPMIQCNRVRGIDLSYWCD